MNTNISKFDNNNLLKWYKTELEKIDSVYKEKKRKGQDGEWSKAYREVTAEYRRRLAVLKDKKK